uniref:hypothetical protein n=1 Tax=Altererythrobacter segetis TaxID=1104773 RepID=UPI00140BBF4D|nr:hypothetical protein [Altererythrobacter segetis]
MSDKLSVGEAIAAVREDYVDQLIGFIAEERQRDPSAEPGRRLVMPQSRLFARTYVPDIYVAGPPERMSDLIPRKRAGKLPGFSFSSTNLTVEFDDLWWDDLRLDHNGAYTAPLISAWFRRWFAAEDGTAPRGEGVEGFIHSATVDEKWITVDMGSASTKALYELLNVTQKCGATLVHVSAARPPA